MIPRLPAIAEPDQRYWRSRANRKVRKERLARSVARWSGWFAAHVLILTVLAFATLEIVRHAAAGDWFAVSRIEVVDAQQGASDGILRRLAPLMQTNLFDVDLDRVQAEVQQESWVRSCSIRRIVPGTLRIRVEERTPTLIAILDGEAMLVDETGFVIGPVQGDSVADLPVLSGLDRFDGESQAAALRDGIELLETLQQEAPEFAASLSELDLSRGDRIVARTLLAGPEFYLDPERADRNLSAFMNRQQEFERRVGEVLAVDLRWNGQIAFTPVGKVR